MFETNGDGEELLFQLPKLINDEFDENKEASMKNGQHAKDKETCLTTVLNQYLKILTQRRDKQLGYFILLYA